MKKFIKKLVLCLFVTGLLLHPIEPVAALARRRIIHYQNEVGPYYHVDLNQDEKDESSEEHEEVEEKSESEVSIEEEEHPLPLEFKEETKEEKLEDEGFYYLEAIDGKTTIRI